MLLCKCFLDLNRTTCAHPWQPAAFVIKELNLIGPCSTKIPALKGPVSLSRRANCCCLICDLIHKHGSCMTEPVHDGGND